MCVRVCSAPDGQRAPIVKKRMCMQLFPFSRLGQAGGGQVRLKGRKPADRESMKAECVLWGRYGQNPGRPHSAVRELRVPQTQLA